MEKFEKVFNEWCGINSELENECGKYITSVLNKIPNNEVIISEGNEFSVSYDGGRHPEYASNCFSNVERVYLQNGIVYLETEDTNGYELCNLNTEEMYRVANAIKREISN